MILLPRIALLPIHVSEFQTLALDPRTYLDVKHISTQSKKVVDTKFTTTFGVKQSEMEISQKIQLFESIIWSTNIRMLNMRDESLAIYNHILFTLKSEIRRQISQQFPTLNEFESCYTQVQIIKNALEEVLEDAMCDGFEYIKLCSIQYNVNTDSYTCNVKKITDDRNSNITIIVIDTNSSSFRIVKKLEKAKARYDRLFQMLVSANCAGTKIENSRKENLTLIRQYMKTHPLFNARTRLGKMHDEIRSKMINR